MSFPSPSQELASTHHANVLVVDDESELVAVICEMLDKNGYTATGLSNAQAALSALKETAFDVLLVDLMMPGMDGISLLKAALGIDPYLVGILMTGQGTVQTAVDAMKAGAFDYILKPFRLNAILSVMERSLEVRRLRMENIQLREAVNIYELGKIVTSTLNLDAIFDKTAGTAMQLCEADEVSILLPAQDGDELVIASSYGKGRDYLVGQRVPIRGTITGWVASHYETLILQGQVDDPRFSSSFPRQEIYASISTPMILANKLVGVFNVNKIHRRTPVTQGQIRALSILVSIMSAALENARLYDQTEKRLDHLASLRTIDLAIASSLDLRVTLSILLDQVSTQLNVDATLIRLLDPKTQSLDHAASRGFRTAQLENNPVMVGEGYAGAAALERRTVSVHSLPEAGPDPNREAMIVDEGFHTCFATPLIIKGQVEGVLEVFHRSPFSPDIEWLEFLEALAGQAAIAINSAKLFDNLQFSNQQLTLAYNATIEGWSRALDLRDKETEGHTRRVTEMTLKLAHKIKAFDEEDLVQIRRGALLHDIGKMGVPDSILLKPAALSQEEEAVMRRHPEYAYQLLSPIAYLRKALDIPHFHHEHWDGGGYPQRLKGEQIPLAARLFSVVDVWDALRSDRPYRPGWPDDKVIEYIREQSGKYFDPQVVDLFLETLEEESR